MVAKTITVDLEAYERLTRIRRAGQSFSEVIREHVRVPAPAATADDWLVRLDQAAISEETLAAIELAVQERRRE